MRKIMLLVLLVPVVAWGQEIPFNREAKDIIYDSVYEVNGTKDELYTKAKVWIADIFRSSIRVIDADDKESGLIVCKGNIKYTVIKDGIKGRGKRKSIEKFKVGGDAEFNLKIFLKDNKCRIVVDGIRIPMLEEATAAGLGDLKTEWAILNSVTAYQKDDTIEERVRFNNYQSRDMAVNDRIGDMMHSLRSALNKKGDFDF